MRRCMRGTYHEQLTLGTAFDISENINEIEIKTSVTTVIIPNTKIYFGK